ncbi:uncharacterized protein LOC117123108 isoform X2 [Anneissia japonica]|uniref:uncharacterized protein LOC117123108 isoform X2 n=2 Tax=Anneissia japonica TaxID=1529436 RepID=UPI001425A55A|nr:uncharacterized protein LOC117123108 isoform X2 [Anneissia japonica]
MNKIDRMSGLDFDKCVIGVDVGGTNTDAVILYGDRILGSAKERTTNDVTTGVKKAMKSALKDAENTGSYSIAQVNIGTTHFVNAVVQRQGLAKVAVIRLCGTASKALPPFSDFPDDLRKVIEGPTYLANGGFQVDGRPITTVDESEINRYTEDIKAKGLVHIAVCGVFSPVNQEQENLVGEIIMKHFQDAEITYSHRVGQMGLLERENAAILNASLKPLCQQTLQALATALLDIGLTCPYYLTQNDGTIKSAEQTKNFPVHTFSSGPTNSMRGAALLSGIKNAVVIDIGGTTTDIGCLRHGFPREASSHVQIGGVSTKLRMPDVMSIGLGGGSKVVFNRTEEGDITECKVGPESVGYKLAKEALVFGGTTLTTTDVAVAAGLVKLGNRQKVENLEEDKVSKVIEVMKDMIENVVDQMKLSKEDLPYVLVGGGSILLNENQLLEGATTVIKPPHYQVANAVGAALSQVGGVRDTIVNLTNISREVAVEEAKKAAINEAVKNGADIDTVKVTEVEEISLTYIYGCTRIKVKAVGDLMQTQHVVGSPQPTHTPPSEVATDMQTTEGESLIKVPKVDPGKQHDMSDNKKEDASLPAVDKETGEWHLSEYDIECISVGAGILGCGGGGSPYLGRLHAMKLLKQGKKIRVIAPERLGIGKVAVCGFMGAPGVIAEKLVSGEEMINAIHCQQSLITASNEGSWNTKDIDIKSGDGIKYIEDYCAHKSGEELVCNAADKIVGLMSAEIGGMNAMEPLVIGGLLDLPVVDCDGMGRAFPELQMFVPSIYGKSLVPSCLVDDKGQRAVILEVEDAKKLENHFRQTTISMGCSAAVSFNPLSKQEILDKSVLYSLSRARNLGDKVLSATSSPLEAILTQENGTLLIIGKVSNVVRINKGGFDKGNVTIEGALEWSECTFSIEFQNENLLARMSSSQVKEKTVATVPDLICIVDSDSGQPIPTDEIRYGLRVAVLVIPAAPCLKTQQALEIVGPRAFGIQEDFLPIGSYKTPLSIPMK